MASASSSDPAATNWKDVPPEIKLQVLRYRLFVAHPLTYRTHTVQSRRTGLLSLLLTSKEMHGLASEAYYGTNAFTTNARIGSLNEPIFIRRSFSVGLWIRTLEIKFDMTAFGTRYKTGDGLDSYASAIFFLVERNNYGNEENKEVGKWWYNLQKHTGYRLDYHNDGGSTETVQLTHWQRHFPYLKHLKIVLQRVCCMKKDEREVIEKLPSYAKIAVSPKDVYVMSEDHLFFGCERGPETSSIPSGAAGPCDGRCAEVLEGAIRSMVQLRKE